MLNKNSLAVKKVRGQSEATNISDQKLQEIEHFIKNLFT